MNEIIRLQEEDSLFAPSRRNTFFGVLQTSLGMIGKGTFIVLLLTFSRVYAPNRVRKFRNLIVRACLEVAYAPEYHGYQALENLHFDPISNETEWVHPLAFSAKSSSLDTPTLKETQKMSQNELN